jgi:arginase family enzyme
MIKELINAMEFTGNVKQLKTVLADVNELADAVDAAEITTLNTVNIKLAE